MSIPLVIGKKAIAFIGIAVLAVVLCFAPAAETGTGTASPPAAPAITLPNAPTIISDGAIVINAQTGAVLFEKNSHGIFHPASCTKILTALLALENGTLSDTVTMSHNAIWGIDRDSSHIALDVGETVSVNDLLHGLLIASGNECAMGLAEYISAQCGGGGTVDDFVTRMNQRAAELGAENTNFVNPHGLYDAAHVSTPYDLAQIMRHAIQNETFVSISSTTQYTVRTDRVPEGHPFSHSNKMLTGGQYYNSAVVCGKTGYTRQSGSSLVTYARSGSVDVIVVTMGTDALSNSFADTNALLDYCFEHFTAVTPADTEKASASLELADGVEATVYSDLPENVLLPNGLTFGDLTTQITAYSSLTLPLSAGTPVGTVRWYYLDREFASGTVYTAAAVMPPAPEEDTTSKDPLFLKILLIAALVLVGLVALFFIAAFINRTIRRIRRKRRKKVHQKGNIFR